MIGAHIRTYNTIHEIRSEQNFPGTTRVGAAHHLRVFDPEKGDPQAKGTVRMLEHVFHDLFLEGMVYGRFLFPIGNGGYPYGKGTYCDFMGINYYSRDIVSFSMNPLRLFGDLKVREGAETNDLGWEIYPEGLYRVCKKAFERYPFPIYITENGICDAEDQQRGRFIYDHLKVVKELIEDGVPVERYYHWSLIDNFEWDEGLGPKFGLIEVDYDTQKRTVRESGKFYGEVSKAGGVTEEMLEAYPFLPTEA
ncbi:Beta-glucosidase [Lentibacillus sp. JNUCC-1]|uniref:family 1 glycosylhydrolase n=1 Tax=Lentibacillus sp. JNUCC-1 TaxID=2654513 RepID=UPI001324F7C9|nr:family 1 glycosylhydrolase [Lentibacillus sp. JNUCC-1]MUV36884.1 Beta-glucosidase [Lentibacillus sp. JNUCC-1]